MATFFMKLLSCALNCAPSADQNRWPISAVASVCYVLAWEATVAITHMDFANGYANAMIEQQKARGLSGAAAS